MAVVGVILLLVAVLLFLFGLLGAGGDTDTFDVLGVHVTMSAASVFILGVVATVIALLGLAAMRRGARRAREHRADKKRVNRLSRELDQARKDAGEDPPVAREDPKTETDRPTPI